MSHFLAVVIVPNPGYKFSNETIKAMVSDIIHSLNEYDHTDIKCYHVGGLCDWYRIGGRFSGTFEDHKKNKEEPNFYEKIEDKNELYEGDIIPLKELYAKKDQKYRSYILIEPHCAYGEYLEWEEYRDNGKTRREATETEREEFLEKYYEILEKYLDGDYSVVAVDCHS